MGFDHHLESYLYLLCNLKIKKSTVSISFLIAYSKGNTSLNPFLFVNVYSMFQ